MSRETLVNGAADLVAPIVFALLLHSLMRLCRALCLLSGDEGGKGKNKVKVT